jgi:recombination protein RecA
LGIGGLPIGRIVEIYGPESSGKTTLMLSAIAQAQQMGGVAAFIDAEHALDPSYAKKLGVNIDDLLVSQPDNGEEALEICESLVRSNAIDIIVIDSVAALVPKAEIEGDMGDSHMGLQARLMSQALRKLTGTISKSKTTVVFINQIRMKIGVMFGSPETTTGGNALKFYASIRLDIRKIETLKEKEESIGNRVRVKVVKNKCAPPFRQAEFDIMFNSGINRESSLIDLAVKHDIIVKGGSWYSFNSEKLGQGKESVRAYMLEHPEFANNIEKQIRELNELPARGNKDETPVAQATSNGKSEKKSKNSGVEEIDM